MAVNDKPDLIWEPYLVGRPADTHYSAGGSSPLLRDDETNRLSTHAVIGDRIGSASHNSVGESEAIKALAAAGALALVAIAAFGVKKLWDLAKSERNGTSAGTDVERSDGTSAAADVDEHEAIIDEVNALIEETRASGSRVEASNGRTACIDEEASEAPTSAPRRRTLRTR